MDTGFLFVYRLIHIVGTIAAFGVVGLAAYYMAIG